MPHLALIDFLSCMATAGQHLPAESHLRAGVERVDITAPVDTPLAGYAARTLPSTGVHDPLRARFSETFHLVQAAISWR